MPAAPLHRIKRLGLGGLASKPVEKELFGELQVEMEPRFEETEQNTVQEDTLDKSPQQENFFVTGEEVPG